MTDAAKNTVKRAPEESPPKKAKARRVAKKSSGKTTATGKPFVKGDTRIRRGKGPKKGAPNAGRPPSAIREAYRMAADARLAFICSVIDGKVVQEMKIGDSESVATVSADVSDRLRAWDMLNKYGIGTTITETDTDGKNARASGVIVVPGAVTAENWEIAAVAQQRALVEAKKRIAKEYGVE